MCDLAIETMRAVDAFVAAHGATDVLLATRFPKLILAYSGTSIFLTPLPPSTRTAAFLAASAVHFRHDVAKIVASGRPRVAMFLAAIFVVAAAHARAMRAMRVFLFFHSVQHYIQHRHLIFMSEWSVIVFSVAAVASVRCAERLVAHKRWLPLQLVVVGHVVFTEMLR